MPSNGYTIRYGKVGDAALSSTHGYGVHTSHVLSYLFDLTMDLAP